MTGIEMIAQERAEQIEKHGYTVEWDAQYSDQLMRAALSIATYEVEHFPFNRDVWKKIMAKPLVEKLAVVGAFLAAEIDRLKKVYPKIYDREGV